MTFEETKEYIKQNNVHLKNDYIKNCIEFALSDSNSSEYSEIHHIIPRCLGGKDDPQNLIKVTREHHCILHKSIIGSYKPKKASNTITKAQYKKLYYAMCKMNNIKLPIWLNN